MLYSENEGLLTNYTSRKKVINHIGAERKITRLDTETREPASLLLTHIKLDVKLVLEEVVHVPALAEPPRAVLGGLQPKPVVVRLLVLAHILPTERREKVRRWRNVFG